MNHEAASSVFTLTGSYEDSPQHDRKFDFLCAPTHIFEFQEFIHDLSLFYSLD